MGNPGQPLASLIHAPLVADVLGRFLDVHHCLEGWHSFLVYVPGSNCIGPGVASCGWRQLAQWTI